MKTIKQLLLVTFMLLFTVVSYSQDDLDTSKTETKVSTAVVYNDSKEAVKIVYSDVKSLSPDVQKALNKLGKSLNSSAEEVWQVLIKQQLVYSIGILIVILLTIGSWIHFYYRINEYRENPINNKGDLSESRGMVSALCCIIALVGTATSIIHFNMMLTGFINPKYGAIMDIMNTIKLLK